MLLTPLSFLPISSEKPSVRPFILFTIPFMAALFAMLAVSHAYAVEERTLGQSVDGRAMVAWVFGANEALAIAMSEAIDGCLPVKKLGGRPGSLDSYVGEVLGKPIITLEFPEGAEEKDAATLWEEYGPALIVFVRSIEQ